MTLRTWHIELAVVASVVVTVTAVTATRYVDCHPWGARYWVVKEFLWIFYFVSLGTWAPVVGAVVFLFYPVWRSLYRETRS